jgi:hypothetical protein
MVKYDLIQIEQRYTQLVDKLLNCRTITSVGITCNKSVELDNLVASCQQFFNKSWEQAERTINAENT